MSTTTEINQSINHVKREQQKYHSQEPDPSGTS